MKNVIFLVSSIYPMDNGRALGSYGYCKGFSKYSNMKIFSPLPHSIPKEEAKKAFDENIDIEFFQESSNKIIRGISSFGQRVIFKLFGTIEPITRDMYRAVVSYIKSHKVDIIIFDHFAMSNYFWKLKKKFPDIMYVYNSHNVEAVNFYQQLTGKSADGTEKLVFDNKLQELMYDYFSKREKDVLEAVDYTIALSKNDLNQLSDKYHIDKKKMLWTKPMATFKLIKTIDDVRKYHYKLLIVGTMGWYPNARGAMWFMNEVFSKIIEKNPKYQLYIVGRDPMPELVEEAKKYPNNVIVTGAVESMDPYFKMCDISVIPVFDGTGIKTKVLESMGNGIPTLCSGFAAKDYDISGEVAVADTAQEFINHIDRIEKSVEVREQYYIKMKKYCDDFYDLTDDLKGLLDIHH